MSEKKIPVTIIINVYNGDAYLEEAIESVRNQTFKDFKLLIFDNCSTDNTAQIANKYVHLDSRVLHVLNTDFCSLGEARQRAIDKTTTTFVGFLDSDDIMLPDSLEKRMNKIQSNPDFITCICGHHNYLNNKIIATYLPNFKADNQLSFLLLESGIMPSGMLINREKLLSSNVIFDTNLKTSEEVLFALELCMHGLLCAVEEPLFYYRIHESSLTANNLDRFYFEREYVFNKLQTKYPDQLKGYEKEWAVAKSRINYYKAQYLFSQNKNKEARIELGEVSHVSILYRILYSVSFVPPLWRFLHTPKVKLALQKIALSTLKSGV